MISALKHAQKTHGKEKEKTNFGSDAVYHHVRHRQSVLRYDP